MPEVRSTVMLLMVGAGLGLTAPAAAQTPPTAKRAVHSGDSLFGDNRSDSEATGWSIGGRISFDLQNLMNGDLDRMSGGTRKSIRPEARIEVTYRPDKDIELFGSVEAGTTVVRQDGQWTSRETLELRELYLLVDHSIARQVQFQIGRQDFEDNREWLYDERLDAVRFAYDHQKWRVEVAYGREELLRRDLFHRNRGRKKVDNFIVHSEYELTPDWDLAAYVIKQKDRRSSDVSPLFVGFQSEGKITGNLGHWLDIAVQGGKAGGRRLRANAIDAGLTYRFDAPLQPTLIAGFARGSGGGNARTDRNFRQTGLQDNEDRISGLGNVRYYGELLDPDLSNLKLATLGLGLRPSSRASLEFIAHRYWQVSRKADNLTGSPIDVETNGRSRNIGTELDAIFAARLRDDVGIEVKLGWFRTGSAFDGPANDDALFAKLRLVKRF